MGRIAADATVPTSSDLQQAGFLHFKESSLHPNLKATCMLTDFQEKKITLLFHFWDYDSSGTLRRDDYMAVGQRMADECGWKPGSPAYRDLHERLMADWKKARLFADSDNDKAISLEEWRIFCDHLVNDPEMYQLAVTNIASAIIESADADGDGKLSPEEWAMIFRVYGWQDEETALRAFSRLDKDGDGGVTKKEFLDALAVFFMSDDASLEGNYIFGPLD